MVQEGEMEKCWSKGTTFQLCWINEVWRPKRREEEEEDQIGSLGQTMPGSEATAQI